MAKRFHLKRSELAVAVTAALVDLHLVQRKEGWLTPSYDDMKTELVQF